MKLRIFAVSLAALALAACAPLPAANPASPAHEQHVVATTSDGIIIHAEAYPGDLPETAPLILLFHQGGSNARGEFGKIAGWLNSLGYRALAWDLRKGGDLFEGTSRTLAGLPEGADPEFCDAYADVEAALDYTIDTLGADDVVLLGSSYSGSLVFQLASTRPDHVAGVIAFSPASGGPVAQCRASLWLGGLKAPGIVFRPLSEMERDSSQVQRDALETAGVEFFVADPGVHGASMLLETRVGGDVSAARAALAEWLMRIRPAS